jgi:alkylation response protein AidB-like acyl-CoA dehydrogenase
MSAMSPEPTTAPPETATARQEQLRSEVKAFINQSWDTSVTVGEWWRRLAEAGWSMPSWPVGMGGRGLRSSEARIVTEELAAAGVIGPPTGIAVTLAGPTLLASGTPEQQADYVFRIASGEHMWCQLFSEPGAGSDLASVTARAERDGDEWIVNGQKVWNSGADLADKAILLARTDTSRKHGGLSYFVIDMHQPGVDPRPLKQMNGESEFCEVFLTDARVRDQDLVGTMNEGWKITKTTLGFERAMVTGRAARGLVSVTAGSKAGNLTRTISEVLSAQQARRTRAFGRALPTRQLLELAKTTGKNTDPNIRQQLVRYYSMNEINRFTQQRMQAAMKSGRVPGPEGSIMKLAVAHVCHASRELVFSILGMDATITGEAAPGKGVYLTVALDSFGASIGGGTDEIQRNLIGERALGLPREPGEDRT